MCCENISPGLPSGFLASKLNTCATPSKTNASPITVGLLRVCHDIGIAIRNERRGGQEVQLARSGSGQAIRRPRLIPDHIDLCVANLGQGGEPVSDVADDTRRKRAPPGREQQLDPRLPVLNMQRPDQPHVDERDALLSTTWVVDIAQ